MKTGNSLRAFEPGVSDKLQTYVYALRDPRDRKVFYVGKGRGVRVFDHFSEAENEQNYSSKVRRIREIWHEGLDVEWFIVRRQIRALDGDKTADESAEEIEAAIIDVLEHSQNGSTLNDQSGKRSQIHGFVNSSDVQSLAAPAVNPSSAFPIALRSA
jgi:hypothetical protein